MNREYVVRVPDLIWAVPFDQHLELRRDVRGRAPAVAVAVDGVAAPLAMKRAAARADERHGPHAVVRAPHADVAVDVDGVPIGERQRVEVLDVRARRVAHDAAPGVAVDDSGDRARSSSRASHARRATGARPS